MKYVRRTVWYIAVRLFFICLILGIAMTVFYYAMNLSNIQVILKDGMANRTKVIMGMDSGAGELSKYFQAACLNADEELIAAQSGNSRYANYNIRGIDHRLDMGFLWTWPWDTSTRVTIREKVPRIDGRVKGTKADEVIAQNGGNSVYPPSWPEASYRVNLVKESGQWKIRSLTPISE